MFNYYSDEYWLQGNCSNCEIDVAVQHFTVTLNKAIRYSIPQKGP